MGAIQSALALVRGLSVETVESSCCGMAGAFGYVAETYEVSMAMGELSLLPAVRKAGARYHRRCGRFLLPAPDSRRHRPPARHVARILRDAMSDAKPNRPRLWIRVPVPWLRLDRRRTDLGRLPGRWTLWRAAGRVTSRLAGQTACSVSAMRTPR